VMRVTPERDPYHARCVVNHTDGVYCGQVRLALQVAGCPLQFAGMEMPLS